eukprot:CAMPEP_0177557282 /NCGR_PEP_ID=MMETSP0369-20130122/69577_1 /TAXON_ID=447022 ORGANISM="Scrippsiella hangoei-like, Strain SHHI-4" /NCGR_SAMPLE_ID=MMETSP0369 /ASSEMBLY_ACC=CAM_ASM_000364 /LENGTH=57 /DNA_ID=CAMNT_0019043649 /DNA_START=257 /DNA_END=433 /DNA_ORIENTATION=+
MTPLDADTNFSSSSGLLEKYEIMATSKASVEAPQGLAERTSGPVATLRGCDTKWQAF